MALKLPILAVSLVVWTTFLSPIQAEQEKKINLTVGESHQLKIERALRVHVTRKGIIHLVHEHDDTWQMTALRSGVVAIEVKSSEQQPQIIYVHVKPTVHETRRPVGRGPPSKSQCGNNSGTHNEQYEVHTTVEMADSTRSFVTGRGLNATVQWTPNANGQTISFETSPQNLSTSRKIIADPVITTIPCVDIEVRAGGEEHTNERMDSNIVTGSWKLHGLAVNMEVIPLTRAKVRIPYQVSLRIPTRKLGSYSLSEAKSSMDLQIGMRKLAAVINLSSSNGERKSSFFLADIPILGPLITARNDSESSSKLFIWLQVRRLENL